MKITSIELDLQCLINNDTPTLVFTFISYFIHSSEVATM